MASRERELLMSVGTTPGEEHVPQVWPGLWSGRPRSVNDRDHLLDSPRSVDMSSRDVAPRAYTRRRCRRRGVVWRFAGGLLLCTLVAVALTSRIRRWGGRPNARSGVPGLSVALASYSGCGHIQRDVDYVFEGDFMQLVPHVDDEGRCCSICELVDTCEAWSWAMDGEHNGQCWLKGGALIQKYSKPGVTSGLKASTIVDANLTTDLLLHGNRTLAGNSSLAGNESLGANYTLGGIERLDHHETPTASPATQPEVANEAEVASKVANRTGVNNTATGPAARPDNGKEDAAPPDGLNVSIEAHSRQHHVHKDTLVNYTNCSALGSNCRNASCCRDAGYQCFEKDSGWAECTLSCVPNAPNFADDLSSKPWSCTPLGARTPGQPPNGTEDGANCIASKACRSTLTQCFAKNETWAECRRECTPGMDMGSPDPLPWSCEPFGLRVEALPEWVNTDCAEDHTDCSKAGCCVSAGKQCYLKDQWYGECMDTCEAADWNACTPFGPRTPVTIAPKNMHPQKGIVGPWVSSMCSGNWRNCSESKCCHAVGSRCFEKNNSWAECKLSCSTEPDPQDGNRSWTCREMGPRSWGLAVKGYPSLYCCSLYMPSSYERSLMRMHLNKSAGIFQCDGFDIFAAEVDTLGATADGVTVQAVLIPKIEVGVSQDGTAGNAKLFMAFWDAIIAKARFRYFDFTAKVDPDAVLIAWRLRSHMEPHVGENIYVVNCNKVPGSPNFPMMFGALEVFSGPAMAAYADGSWKCGSELPWQSWGEDYYMTHCMDYLGVGRIWDFSVLGDNTCTGSNCGDGWVAAFHPYKTEASWGTCWDQAAR